MINVMTKAAQKRLMKLHEATPGTGTGTSTCRTVRYPVRVPYSVRVPYLVTMNCAITQCKCLKVVEFKKPRRISVLVTSHVLELLLVKVLPGPVLFDP